MRRLFLIPVFAALLIALPMLAQDVFTGQRWEYLQFAYFPATNTAFIVAGDQATSEALTADAQAVLADPVPGFGAALSEVAALDLLGSMGWEIVTYESRVTGDAEYTFAIFKRSVPGD